jgi:hypothetical protein
MKKQVVKRPIFVFPYLYGTPLKRESNERIGQMLKGHKSGPNAGIEGNN